MVVNHGGHILQLKRTYREERAVLLLLSILIIQLVHSLDALPNFRLLIIQCLYEGTNLHIYFSSRYMNGTFLPSYRPWRIGFQNRRLTYCSNVCSNNISVPYYSSYKCERNCFTESSSMSFNLVGSNAVSRSMPRPNLVLTDSS